mmetsp:Transcript_14908/g.30003  ORF Transcript_14908/g.30003 Transcript_14908/m.30003 type:complete len:106 (+) Transcript_14908:387-704(+)
MCGKMPMPRAARGRWDRAKKRNDEARRQEEQATPKASNRKTHSGRGQNPSELALRHQSKKQARRHWQQPQNGKDRTRPTEKAGQKQQQSSNKKEGIRIVGQGRER